MKMLNLIMIIITFFSISFTLYYIYNFCTNLDVFEYNNINYTKTLLLIGGVHGNEPSGSIGLIGLKTQLDENKIDLKKTRIILMPYVNKCGLAMNLRNLLFFTDINRNFIDDTKSNINIKILEYVKMIKNSDLIIDIHEGYDFHRINNNSIGSTLFASTEFALEITQKIYNILNVTITDPNKQFKILTYNTITDNNMYSPMPIINGTLDYYTFNNKINYILIEITGQNSVHFIEDRIKQLGIIFTVIQQLYVISEIK